MADDADQDSAKERRYTADELREYARSRFGCSPHVLVAVLSAETAQTFTLDQAAKLVKNAGKPVEPDNEGEADDA